MEEINPVTTEDVIGWIESVSQSFGEFATGIANPFLVVVVIITALMLIIGIAIRKFLFVSAWMFSIGFVIFILLRFYEPITMTLHNIANNMMTG